MGEVYETQHQLELGIYIGLNIAKKSCEMKLDQHYLQQLPLSPDGKGFIDLPPDEKEDAFNQVWEAFITGEFQERWEVAKYIPKFGERAIEPLTILLQDETADLDLRCEAASLLSQFQQPHAIFSLTEVLNTDTELEVITACANGLAKSGKMVIPILNEALNHSESRLAAVQALTALRDPEIITPLLSVLDDEQAVIRSRAIEALSRFRDHRIIPTLIQALSDTNAKVRQEAVIGLGVRGNDHHPDEVVKALIPLLYDFNLDVCSHCAIALGRLTTSQAITALQQCLESSVTPLPLQKQIIRAISHRETEETLSPLISNLQKQSSTLQEEIITIFGRWQNNQHKKTIVDTLLKFFRENPSAQTNNRLKQTLAQALGNLGILKGKNLLWELCQDEASIVQLHAQAALKKLPYSNQE